MKVNISMNDELVERVDNYSKDNYMSRSGLIALACSQFLAQNEALKAIKDVSLAIRKIADNGVIDEKSQSQLKDFEVFVKMIVGE